jgi:hypothetical protein
MLTNTPSPWSRQAKQPPAIAVSSAQPNDNTGDTLLELPIRASSTGLQTDDEHRARAAVSHDLTMQDHNRGGSDEQLQHDIEQLKQPNRYETRALQDDEKALMQAVDILKRLRIEHLNSPVAYKLLLNAQTHLTKLRRQHPQVDNDANA